MMIKNHNFRPDQIENFDLFAKFTDKNDKRP